MLREPVRLGADLLFPGLSSYFFFFFSHFLFSPIIFSFSLQVLSLDWRGVQGTTSSGNWCMSRAGMIEVWWCGGLVVGLISI